MSTLITTDYTAVISNDYGDDGIKKLKEVLEIIPKIFMFINLEQYDSIQIFKPNNFDVRELGIAYTEIQSYDQIVGISSRKLVIQIEENTDLVVSTEDIDDKYLLPENFYYLFKKKSEGFCTKTQFCDIQKPSGSHSLFSISTFKDLDEALLNYKNNVAKNSECPRILSAFHCNKKIFFKPRPEHFLRDSLAYFLKARLRGESLEIRPEQNVDDSHPIDIKVSWGLTNHIALIEVKWIGKSIKEDRTSFTATYGEPRAKEGAQQLIQYLETNKISVPSHNTKGYLVVFDLRRANTNLTTVEINHFDGYHFENLEISYDAVNREDYAQPTRMFINPICTT